MDRRLKNGLLLMAIGILLSVATGLFGLALYVSGGNSTAPYALLCLFGLIEVGSYVLIVIALIMIFTRRKTLGEDKRFVTWGFISLIVLIVAFIVSIIVGLFTIITMNPRYFTIFIISLEAISAILGTLVIFLPVYPLVSKDLRKKIKYSIAAITIIVILLQPLVFFELEAVEDAFYEEFDGRDYSSEAGDDDDNENLTEDVSIWFEDSIYGPEVENLMVYYSFTLIIYAYLGIQIFTYARALRKKKPFKPGFRYPRTHGPSMSGTDAADGDLAGKCKFCGTDLIPGVDFCPSCGAYLRD